ncbi:MAG: GTA-gp10 family protein [Pseudomonadota bacterium]
MGIVVTAPLGGITAEIAGETRRLVLRNREIERFEERHAPIGLFDVMNRLISPEHQPTVQQCRDLTTLGLIGGGMSDAAADQLVAGVAPSKNVQLRTVAVRLVMAAFAPAPGEDPPNPPADGDDEVDPEVDTTSPNKSDPSSEPD